MSNDLRNLEARILVVDDEASIREFLEIMLKREKYSIETSASPLEALELMKNKFFDLVISDISMPDMSGIDFLQKVRENDRDTIFIMITAHGSTESAVEAMKLGAYDYITKPFKIDDIKLRIKNALEKKILVTENIYLKKELKSRYSFSNIIGSSSAMMKVYDLVRKCAQNRSNVLITGQSGTGKELIARAVHYNGILKDKPFVTINCGAIPENLMESEMFGHKKGSFTGAIGDKKGLFEVANGGTIFLDEIGDLPMTMQVKLLRVIQEGTFRPVGGVEDVSVNVRVIAATNRNLQEMITQNTFREDLYYRLNVITIHSPRLRDRIDDIPMLVSHFVERFNEIFTHKMKGISKEALEILRGYIWPGNVRELENVIERAMALSTHEVVLKEDLPAHIVNHPAVQKFLGNPILPLALGADVAGSAHSTNEAASDGPGGPVHPLASTLYFKPEGVKMDEVIEAVERDLLAQALQHTGGKKKAASKLLGITFRSIRYRVEKFGFESNDNEEEDKDSV